MGRWAVTITLFQLLAVSSAWSAVVGDAADLSEGAWENVIDVPEAFEAFETVREELGNLSASASACGAEIQKISRCPVPAEACKRFIAADCTYGILGVQAKVNFASSFTPRSNVKSGKRVRYAAHYVSNPPSDIALYCPRYSRMDADTRSKFWVWVLMSLAFEESGCGLDVKNEANPRTAGLFQLDKSAGPRKSLRPRECEDAAIARDFPGKTIKDEGPNLRCAMAMLSVQLARPGSAAAETRKDLTALSPGKLFTSASYWQKLKHTEKGLVTLVKSFPACK